ncbi:MAG: glycosyltransferase family 4 protein, partial [Candidatus Helarchaeota archaeon]
MNVCVLGCKSYPPHEYAGGIEINVWETTQRLRNKINFFIFTMHGKGKNVYTVPYISSHITRTPSYCLFAFKKIRELHRKIGFDLLHVHESWAGFFGGYFKKYLKCPLILTMHTIDSLQPEWKWVKLPFSLIERLAIRAADKVITPSYYIQSKLLQSRGLK